jgi:hypothetical protein
VKLTIHPLPRLNTRRTRLHCLTHLHGVCLIKHSDYFTFLLVSVSREIWPTYFIFLYLSTKQYLVSKNYDVLHPSLPPPSRSPVSRYSSQHIVLSMFFPLAEEPVSFPYCLLLIFKYISPTLIKKGNEAKKLQTFVVHK